MLPPYKQGLNISRAPGTQTLLPRACSANLLPVPGSANDMPLQGGLWSQHICMISSTAQPRAWDPSWGGRVRVGLPELPEAAVLPLLECSLLQGTLLERMARAMGLGDSKEGCLSSRLSHIWIAQHGALRIRGDCHRLHQQRA